MSKLRKIGFINKLLKNKEHSTKIYLYFATKTAGDDFDPYEKNYIFSNLNPLVVKAYVRELTSEAAFYKQYGLHQSGAKEIICEGRWRTAFENANKIEIDSIEYQTFKGGNNKTTITKRPYNMVRVVVVRKG